jgi:molybdopterin-binding protein
MLVDVDVDGYMCSALLIHAPEAFPWIRSGNAVGVVFKETEVSLGKNVKGWFSIRNRFPCTITNITRGEILSVVELAFSGHTLASAITTRSADALGIRKGNRITALIKANEMSLMELRK